MSEIAWWLAQVAAPALLVLSGVALLGVACVLMVGGLAAPGSTNPIALAGGATWAAGIGWGWLVNHGARALMLRR